MVGRRDGGGRGNLRRAESGAHYAHKQLVGPEAADRDERCNFWGGATHLLPARSEF